MPGQAVRARGIVQGVGFRPYIRNLAKQHQLRGSVWNDGHGVMIHAWGEQQNLQAFIRQIPEQLPPLARLDSVEINVLAGPPPYDDFVITSSRQNHTAQTPVAADAATCDACLAEINDPHNRRYRYPFTNCTHCGPRLSSVRRIPYDRCNTSMAGFTMCPQCRQEYENPADRRFHAQANCCPACGPQLWLQDREGRKIDCPDVLAHAAELLQQGYILAIKGLGGFHLACDAGSEAAVDLLRHRKRRYAKPLALMARDLAMIAAYAHLGDAERLALQDKAAPIVLLAAKGIRLASGIAPGEDKLGFMLPYTPLHYLLMQPLQRPLVMTSGNLSEEPQCTANDAALTKLHGIADYFVLHDRNIVNRLDDSVLRIMAGQRRMLRRARGFTPEAVALPAGFESCDGILALGGELKNSFCLLKAGQAIVSQHIGDLEDVATQQDYRDTIALYQRLFGFGAQCVAVDLHPGYLSTQYGQQRAMESNLPLIAVQHHHAHIAACLAEHGFARDSSPVLGVVFDGLGMGMDNQLWGGEFLLADYAGFSRLAYLQPIAMPGGVQAIREPWRNAYAQLIHYFDWQWLQRLFSDLDFITVLQSKPLDTVAAMIAKGVNSPLCSSYGRWFDAFAAMLGLADAQIGYEGQAAIALENLAAPVFDEQRSYAEAYTLHQQDGAWVIGWQPLWQAVLTDLRRGRDKATIAARIHHSLADATTATVLKLSGQTPIDTIVLSGGVFQNRLLFESVTRQLQDHGKTVLSAQRYPINDGGLALGQVAIAAAQLRQA